MWNFRKVRFTLLLCGWGLTFLICSSMWLSSYDNGPKEEFIHQKNMEYVIRRKGVEDLLKQIKELIEKHQNSSSKRTEFLRSLLNITLQGKPVYQRPNPSSMQIVIVTTPRSGSTFLKELLTSHPGFFTHTEPPAIFRQNKERIFKSDKFANEAQQVIINILNCGLENSQFIGEMSKNYFPLVFNDHLLDLCMASEENQHLCSQNDFAETACSLFPYSIMKLVHAGVDLLEPIFEELTLNPKMIFLVRDPRAVVASRLEWKVCKTDTCTSPKTICDDLNRDLSAALKLKNKYRDTVSILRYEDLAWSPHQTTQKILDDVGLDFHPAMTDYINTHTFIEADVKDPFSTTRESSNRVLNWLTKITDDVLMDVQRSCRNIMRRLGYSQIKSLTKLLTLKSFNSTMALDLRNNVYTEIMPFLHGKLYKRLKL